MTYVWPIGLAIVAWGAWTIWKHTRECPEVASYLSRFGSVGMTAALAVTVYCAYEIVETAC